VNIVGMDTSEGSGWLVIDAFDIMIHVFTPETREKYALENLWKDAEDIEVNELTKSAATPKPRKKAAATPKKRKPKKSAE
jgi:ribosome-associated protein